MSIELIDCSCNVENLIFYCYHFKKIIQTLNKETFYYFLFHYSSSYA